MNKPASFLRSRLYHVVIAIVAILAAVALVLNYYLW
jgi:hypothetical protein